MSTRAQILSQVRTLINQPDSSDSNVSDSDINSFINQSVRFAGTFLEHPRDFVEVQATEGVGAVALPSDTLLVRTAYFGSKSVSGDIQPLAIVSEETLTGLYPSWMDETSGTKGRPNCLIILDKNTVFMFPRPDADESVTGKKLILDYIYSPATMNSDSDEPDLPLPAHDILQYHAAHQCYLKMSNPQMAKAMMDSFMEKLRAIQPTITKETKGGLNFQWSEADDMDGDGTLSLNPYL